MKVGFKKLMELFWIFFKIGAFTFGGGYAMIPFIQREIVQEHGYIDEDEVVEIVAIAESTPGPVAINMATFVGYKCAGVIGSAFCTLGTVLPSFIIILIISYFYEQFAHLKVIQYAFNGIRAGVLVLLIKALLTVYKKLKKNAIAWFIMGASFIVVAIFGVKVLPVIAASAAIGLASFLLAERAGKKA